MGCFDDNLVTELVSGTLPLEEQVAVQEHLDTCVACRELVGAAAADAAWEHLEPGARVGRYRVTGVIGAGAMGVVYAAEDPELGRTVALKLCAAPRLLREAQALAKLQHPNVVTLHELGTFGDQAFVALEHVAGGTLTTWLATPRSVGEVVRIFVQVGEGLAAAHAAGLVHRDVKPANILVGDRARITDFGLAASHADDDAGKIVGTPAYLAPEVKRGEPADARSDQYAFCLSLDEALPAKPRWLDKIVRRGLAANPADRWPDMRALVDALQRGPVITRNRVIATVIAMAAIGGYAYAAHEPKPCQHLPAWNVPIALAQRLPVETAATVERAFRDYGTAWSKLQLETCLAHDVPAVKAARARCLDERRAYAVELAHALQAGPAPRVDGALEVAGNLPSVDECANGAALLQIVAPPETPGEILDRTILREQMVAATIDGYLRVDMDPHVFAQIADRAHSIGMPALEARALLLEARASSDEEAEEHALQASARAAIAARDDAALADAWQRMTFHTGFHAGRFAESAEWAQYTRTALARLGGDPVREAELEMSRGFAFIYADKGEEALAAHRRAVELFTAARGPDYWRIATALYGEGTAWMVLGKPEQAKELYEQSRALAKQLGGVTAQAYVTASDNMANALIATGKLEQGLALFDELDRSTGTSAWRQLQIAIALRDAKRYAEALDRDRRAEQLTIAEKQTGARELYPVLGEGLDLLELHRPAEALPLLERVAATSPDQKAAAQEAVDRAKKELRAERK
ncbi:MAG: protein kinase [Kofleriaceae bacterium]